MLIIYFIVPLIDDFLDTNEEQEAREAYRQLMQREGSKSLPRRPFLMGAASRQQEEEEVEAETRRLESLYGRQGPIPNLEEGHGPLRRLMGESGLGESLLTPTVRDPKLWLVKCKPGKERELCFNLMRKFYDAETREKPLKITSALCRDHLKGFIYIEAYNKNDVIAAIDKMFHFYSTKISLVPIVEMTDVLRVESKSSSKFMGGQLDMNRLRPGLWVRVKRGKYEGDLAQIVDVLEASESAVIKLLPRLDIYAFNSSSSARGQDRNGPGRRRGLTRAAMLASRPPAKLFNPKEVR